MSFHLTIPFYAFRLHFQPGFHLSSPLNDLDTFRLNQSLSNLASQYQSAIQKKILDKGKPDELLNIIRRGDFFKTVVTTDFPASGKPNPYPEFSLEFVAYYQEQAGGFWGIIPTLNLEAVAPDLESLLKRLSQTVRIDFVRSRRLDKVQDIVSAIWFQSVELLRDEIHLEVWEPSEYKALEVANKPSWLRNVAQQLEITRQETYGRDSEIRQFSLLLSGNYSRNVLLVGPSGVGKTALVWEISRQLRDRGIPGSIWETTASTLIKELTRDTGWEYNLAELCKELTHSDQILYIRNLMDLFEVGQYEGNELSIADFLLPFLSRGEINIISECTDEQLAKIELSKPSYISNFQILKLEEPQKELEFIIQSKIQSIADQESLRITGDAIREVIQLHRRFTPYAGMPGKPIRFLESILLTKKRHPSEGRKTRKNESETGKGEITRSEVIRHFCQETGMPLSMVDSGIPMFPDKIRTQFKEQIFGQGEAVDSVVDTLVAIKTALNRTGKPIASFLFAGPTGVGKTELAKVLAAFMFGDRRKMIRFDMSEFSSSYSVMRLIGAADNKEGLLTAAIRREPFCLLLFDEIEKAHPNFLDLLLQILGEGRLTDGTGRLADFCSTIVIMTTNIGAETIQNKPVGWKADHDSQQVKEQFLEAVRRNFRPELFNRIDQITSFEPLSRETVRMVVNREIELIKQLEGIQHRKLELQIEDPVLDFLAIQGYSFRYGARQLQRTIRDLLLHPLSQKLNQEEIENLLRVRIYLESEQIRFHIHSEPPELSQLLSELNLVDSADYSGMLRLEAVAFQDSYYFTLLLQELDELEYQKKKEGTSFWNKPKLTRLYSRLQELRDTAFQLLQEIEGLEERLTLLALGLEKNDEADKYAADIEDWEKRFFQLKKDVFSQTNPGANNCFLHIYGEPADRLAALYEAIARKNGFKVTTWGIWFRESYYFDPYATTPDDSPVSRKLTDKFGKYLFFKPGGPAKPVETDRRFGLILQMEGPASYLFWKDESGLQEWHDPEDPKKEQLFYLRVSGEWEPAYKDIHRKEYFRKLQVRRKVSLPVFRDTMWKASKEFTLMANLQSFIAKNLEDAFKNALEKAFQS